MKAIWPTLEAHFSRRSEAERWLALKALRERFLRFDIAADYFDDDATRAAYEAWFFPQSYAKAKSVLAEIDAREVKQIVDIGSGMGPFGFAALEQFPNAQLLLVDRTRGALQSGKELGAALGVKVQTDPVPLEDSAWSNADLVLCGNALFELPEEASTALVQNILARLNPGGHFVIVEPGDRLHSRSLQALRDRLLPRAPLAPCPHTETCPASVRERDFCHQARRLELPPFWHALAEKLGTSVSRMRFSSVIYGPENPSATDLVRIISHRRVEKGRVRYFGCSAAGSIEIMRQDRLRSAANAAFDTLGRGALVRLPRLDALVKLTAEDGLEVIGEADPWDAEA